MAGEIILLNGASSSGKSTLARGLQLALDEPFWHFSIDHLNEAKVLPIERLQSGEFPWSKWREQFFEGFHRCLPALAEAGNKLIVEHIVETEAWMLRLVRLLRNLDVFFVGIHCPLPELVKRESERGNRRLGDARIDFESTHNFAKYDFEISSTQSNAKNVESVIRAWKARKSPSSFEDMARAMASVR